MRKQIASAVAALVLTSGAGMVAVTTAGPAAAIDTISECHEVYETGGALHMTIRSLKGRLLDVRSVTSAVDSGHKWTLYRVDVYRYGARGQLLGVNHSITPGAHFVTTLQRGTLQVKAVALWKSSYDGRVHAVACDTDKVAVLR